MNRVTDTGWSRSSRGSGSVPSTVRACTGRWPSSSATGSSCRGRDAETSAQARRLYRMTGRRADAARWMGVIKEERDGLDAVMRRYVASGGVDAALAEVEGGWGAGPAVPLSAVPPARRRRRSTSERRPEPSPSRRRACPESDHGRFEVVPGGRPCWSRPARTRRADHVRRDGPRRHDRDTSPTRERSLPTATTTAHVVVPVGALRRATSSTTPSCARRIDARHFPDVTLALRDCRPGGAPDHLRVTSDVTIHGVTRRLEGTLVTPSPGPARRGDGGAGRRHPRLRHRLADGADAADLSRRHRQAAGRGRGGRRRGEDR